MSGDRIEELVGQIEALPDARARDAAMELVQAVLDLHAGAIERMMQIVSAAQDGSGIVANLGADPKVSPILLLHNAHPLDMESRVRQALAEVAHQNRGAQPELLSIVDDVVRVRITGGQIFQLAVEQALAEAAPDAAAVVVEGAGEVPSNGFVPLAQLLAG